MPAMLLMPYHGHDDDPREVQRGYNGQRQRRLARARAPRDADDAGIAPRRRVVWSSSHGAPRLRGMAQHCGQPLHPRRLGGDRMSLKPSRGRRIALSTHAAMRPWDAILDL